ncbi:MAG TPA: pilus assembly protein PilM [Candidatus Baltobacteraceae bacterium]|nr:pilus assembly protein PilM [Candidatus Baltobacteraceae bacterium]
MRRSKSLPIGVDIGETRIRVAAARRHPCGEIAVTAVASRQIWDDASPQAAQWEPQLAAAVIDDLRRELGCRERRCVFAMPVSAAALRLLRFPKMSAAERGRAARFEAQRIAPWDVEAVPTHVRVHPVSAKEQLVAIGVARDDVMQGRLDCMKRAGLRVAGVDDATYAMRRAFPLADAVIDIGHRQTTLHVLTPTGPLVMQLSDGGAAITDAITTDLAIEARAAERRKRILGTAGAGEAAREAWIDRTVGALRKLRERSAIRRIAMTGNGARLPGLAPALESRAEAIVEVPVSDLLRSGAYPDDVVRAAAPDWTLAVSLATWGGC